MQPQIDLSSLMMPQAPQQPAMPAMPQAPGLSDSPISPDDPHAGVKLKIMRAAHVLHAMAKHPHKHHIAKKGKGK